jgi:hypothetical protein
MGANSRRQVPSTKCSTKNSLSGPLTIMAIHVAGVAAHSPINFQ